MEALGLDIKLLVAQLVNFAIFFFIFKKFMAKPFMNYLNSQKTTEDTNSKLTETLSHEKENIEKIKSEVLKEAQLAQKQILDSASKTAVGIVDEAKQLAKTQADKIIDEAKLAAASQVTQATAQINQSIKDNLGLIIAKGFSEFLDEDQQKQITKNIVSKI